MKKAMLEQIMIGSILFVSIALFVATVNDERTTRDRIYDLKQIAKETAQAMAKYYQLQVDMCQAETIATDILRETPTGRYLLDNNFINLRWKNLTPDDNKDGIGDDNEPDTVEVTILAHSYPTFWYKFFGKNEFRMGQIVHTEPFESPKQLTLTFGGGISSNDNMVGTYEIDNSGCVTNAKIILPKAKSASVGQQLASNLRTPPTYLFIIPNGGNIFPYAKSYDPVTFSSPHCIGNNSNKDTVKIGTTTKSNTQIFFQQIQLNDGDYFVHPVPANVFEVYNKYVETYEGGSKHTYVEFLEYCKTQEFLDFKDKQNSDADPTNDVIDCVTDINEQYKYGFEDWDQGDDDFNDVLLDGTKFIIVNDWNNFQVNKDGYVNLTCENDNLQPNISLEGCPITMNMNTGPVSFTYTAYDTDGKIVSTEAIADHGITSVDGNEPSSAIGASVTGTIEYTPDKNFGGDDQVTVTTNDNDGGWKLDYCTIHVNTPPEISGTPDTLAYVDKVYTFIPTATDADGDTLTFSIQNLPPWATFDTSTGTLTGIPTEIGTFADIVISVSDGRGGSDSLEAFTIEVVDGDGAPYLDTPIPDQEINENEIFTYDVSAHFKDPDNDVLTYTIDAGGSPLAITPQGVISGKIPDGKAGEEYTIKVTATDPSKLYATDSFILKVTSTGDCNGPFEFTFDNDAEGWKMVNNWNNDTSDADASNHYIDITGNHYIGKAIFFGSLCKEKEISITFDYKTKDNWEYSLFQKDKFEVWKNNDNYPSDTYYRTYNKWERGINTVLKTDSDGWLTLFFYAHTNRADEHAYVDNIKLTSKK